MNKGIRVLHCPVCGYTWETATNERECPACYYPKVNVLESEGVRKKRLTVSVSFLFDDETDVETVKKLADGTVAYFKQGFKMFLKEEPKVTFTMEGMD